MNVTIEITETDLKKMIVDRLNKEVPGADVKETDVRIEVKSKQNYKSEWESAAFRASISVSK